MLGISVFFCAMIGAIKTSTQMLLLHHPVQHGQANLQNETISNTLYWNCQRLIVYILLGCR